MPVPRKCQRLLFKALR